MLAKEILTAMSKYYLSMYMYIVQTEFSLDMLIMKLLYFFYLMNRSLYSINCMLSRYKNIHQDNAVYSENI